MDFPNGFYSPDPFSSFHHLYSACYSQQMPNYHYHPHSICNSYNMISSTLPTYGLNSEFLFYRQFQPTLMPQPSFSNFLKNNEAPIERSEKVHETEVIKEEIKQRRLTHQVPVKEEENESEYVQGVSLRPKKSSHKRKNRGPNRINASYYWSVDENKRYCEFLEKSSQLLELSLSQKKNLRVNVLMSKKVKTRTPQQCHSHHQKMIKKYGTIENLLVEMNNPLQADKNNMDVDPEDQNDSEFQL